jgi:3-methyladenine DNA glycosylase AlkD
LAKSKNLWERRIAILASFTFIKQGELIDTFKLAKILLFDEHDLMHKAVGWMLREVGKRDRKKLEIFLENNIINLPRTTLRYAIEKFSERDRKKWLKK